MEKAQLLLREGLTEKELQELEESIQMVKNFESQNVSPQLLEVAKEMAVDTEKRLRKYKSNRLEGIKSTWSDLKVLEYVTEKVDFRSSHPDLREALEERMKSITSKVLSWKIFNEFDLFRQIELLTARHLIHNRENLTEEEIVLCKFIDKNHEDNAWVKKLIG